MTRTDYLALRRVHRATRDPDLGRLLLAYELKRRPSSPGEVVQLRLTCVEVYCEPQNGRISIAECIKQQSAKTASGAGRGFLLRDACKGCRAREVHRAMSPGFVPPPFRPFNVARENKGRAAKWKATQCGAFGPVRTIDGEE